MPSLAQYLLHLADDPNALERHKRSTGDAKQQMTEYHLTDEQQKILLTGDHQKISSAANEELRAHPKGGKVMNISVNADFIL